MQVSVPILVAALVGLAFLLVFMAFWLIFQKRDPIEQRLEEYGLESGPVLSQESRSVGLSFRSSRRKRTFGSRLAFELKRADIPLTAAEYSLIILGAAIMGYVIGTWRFNAVLGLALAIALGAIPFSVINARQRRRLRLGYR